MAVDSFVAIFAVAHVERIEPVEEGLPRNAVELYQIARQMTVDDSARYAAVEILLQHLLRLFGMAAIAHILLVHGVEIAALYPEALKAALLKLVAHILVGVHGDGFRIRYSVAEQYARHAFACTVLYAESGVDHQPPLRFKTLEFGYRLPFATHIQNHRLADVGALKLSFAVYIHLIAAFAELFGGGIENCRIVADVIGRIGSGSHHAGYLYLAHGSCCFDID